MSLDCSQSKLPGNVLDAPTAPIVMEVQERGTEEGLGECLATLQPLGAERKVTRAGKHPLQGVNGHRSSACRPPSQPALDISIMKSLATCRSFEREGKYGCIRVVFREENRDQ